MDRPRLTDRLHQSVAGPLTVISAPAGYGKSVLVHQWAARHSGVPTAHIELRPDDDARRVAGRLARGLGSLGGAVRHSFPRAAIVQGDGDLDERWLAHFVHELARVGEAILVLDGLDAPGPTALVDDLSTLVRHAPSNIRVIAVQRSRRPVLRHHGVRGEVVVLGQQDLAFTAEEARQLVRAVSGRELTEQELELLLERAGGWAVGLQLAAIALRIAADVRECIESFTGNERHVAAFLRSEVLARQPAELVRFLMQTSGLPWLNGSLCDAVTGGRGGEAMLRVLEHRGVLVHRSPSERDSLMLHPLLRDVVRRDARVAEPNRESTVLVRAAQWHLDRDEPQAAADRFIEAEEWRGLTSLVDRYGRRLFERGAVDLALRWLDAIPAGGAADDQRIGLRRAFLHTWLGQLHKANQVVHGLRSRRLSRGDCVVLDTIRATWVFLDAPPDIVLPAAESALQALDAVSAEEIPNVLGITSAASLRSMAEGSRGRALWQMGDVAGARRSLSALAGQRGVYPPWLTYVLSTLGLLEAWSGNHRIADHYTRRALSVAGTAGLLNHPATLEAWLAMAHVARERGHQHTAKRHLDHAFAVANRATAPVTVSIHTLEHALWHLADRHPDRGLAALDVNRVGGEHPPPPVVASRTRAAAVRMLLALGHTERAQALIDSSVRPVPPELVLPAVQTALARLDVHAARAYVEAAPIEGSEPRRQLECDLARAIIELEAGNRRVALDLGAGVVERAKSEAHVRLFLDAGRSSERLLRALLHAAPSGYVRHILRSTVPLPGQERSTAVAELSDRELEVVRYLPTLLPSTEIAARLFISLNTLKTHLRTIYRKLGVHDRRGAIERARQLGIA